LFPDDARGGQVFDGAKDLLSGNAEKARNR